jgi:hypothetical protein
MNNLPLINQLRKKIPVSILEAKSLLASGNDILKIESDFIEKRVQAILIHISVSPETAEAALRKYNFDSIKAIESLSKEGRSYAKDALLSSNDKLDALGNVYMVIKERANNYDKFRMSAESIRQLPPYQSRVAILVDWLSRIYFDGFGISLEHALIRDVISEMRNNFPLSEYADLLEQAIARKQEMLNQFALKKRPHNYFESIALIEQDEIFMKITLAFHGKRELIYQCLFDYIETNLQHFP